VFRIRPLGENTKELIKAIRFTRTQFALEHIKAELNLWLLLNLRLILNSIIGVEGIESMQNRKGHLPVPLKATKKSQSS